jgi:hypothetical protein
MYNTNINFKNSENRNRNWKTVRFWFRHPVGVIRWKPEVKISCCLPFTYVEVKSQKVGFGLWFWLHNMIFPTVLTTIKTAMHNYKTILWTWSCPCCTRLKWKHIIWKRGANIRQNIPVGQRISTDRIRKGNTCLHTVEWQKNRLLEGPDACLTGAILYSRVTW